jgi:hypothetical protein
MKLGRRGGVAEWYILEPIGDAFGPESTSTAKCGIGEVCTDYHRVRPQVGNIWLICCKSSFAANMTH